MPLPLRPLASSAVRIAATLTVAVVTMAGSCERDAVVPEPAPVVTERANVDERLWAYFDRYEAEAERRGVTINLSVLQLEAAVLDIAEEGVAGECTYDPGAPNRLVVDETLWDDPATSDRLREYVVFHELGHCERLRGHREDEDPDGVCVSVMASGTGDCVPAYADRNREELLDELFDEAFYGDGF